VRWEGRGWARGFYFSDSDQFPQHRNRLLDKWRPSELLAGPKPVEAIERGQLDLVWQVAEGLRTGSLL
jgi:hypothetical protein